MFIKWTNNLLWAHICWKLVVSDNFPQSCHKNVNRYKCGHIVKHPKCSPVNIGGVLGLTITTSNPGHKFHFSDPFLFWIIVNVKKCKNVKKTKNNSQQCFENVFLHLFSYYFLFRYYNNFILCTEHKVSTAKCFWPNPLAEGFITGIHRQFFTNCTSDKVHWEDPPDKILVPLIFIPILLTVAMVGLVVWCSKRSDILV